LQVENTLRALRDLLGPAGIIVGADVEERHLVDVLGQRGERPLAVLRPQDTEQVAAALKLCHAAGVPVVTQGGRTGLARGQLPQAGEIVLSLERMTRIEAVDADGGTALVQAGVVLQALQDRLALEGLMFPLDFGGRGSCTIGGNISTNAGGNRVIRYGMTRDLVVGLEAVLADGTVLDGLKTVIKNNTGPDLKQLFIGSEGTLGVVTRAVLKLLPRPLDRAVALCAVPDFDRVRALLRRARAGLGGDLTAFEVMWDTYFSRVPVVLGKAPPLAAGHAYYVLIEVSGADARELGERLETVLDDAMNEAVVADAVIAKSGAEADRLWHMRDLSIEVSRLLDPIVPFDVSIAVASMDRFVADLETAVRAIDPRCDSLVFGHVGDGNLHLAVHQPPERPEVFDAVEEAVYALVGRYNGSVSAEHGIGSLKRAFLRHSRSPAEIETMRVLKRALDPRNILNPGRILA
jgi:FAD/FMN-containing dehydrogenase